MTNIAELLKDCSKAMELDCTMYENVYFDYVDKLNIIHCYIQGENYVTSITFNQYGAFDNNIKSKCVIFPKGKTTWEGFVPPCKFKDGDVIISDKGDIHLLRTKDSSYCAYRTSWGAFPTFDSTTTTSIKVVRLATEEEKEKLFQAIKDNGYHWNAETKTLEKLITPKFKVGNRVVKKDGISVPILITGVGDIYYWATTENSTKVLPIAEQDDWELVIEPKFKVGDRIRLKENHNYIYTITGIREKENKYECGVTFVLRFSEQYNWELVPNKFDINTLKPFDKVLVRHNEDCCWTPSLFGIYDKSKSYPCICCNGFSYKYCIPYKSNEYLLGITDDCDEYYKN